MPDTVSSLLAGAAGRLPRHDARRLLAAALGREPEFLAAHPEARVEQAAADRFQGMVRQALDGRPLPYILGRAPFWGRDFLVSPATLIPRPDTETLVEAALARARSGPLPARALELGTGSGCVAITLALEEPALSLTATDISAAALRLAAANAARLGAAVNWRRGDWFAALAPGERFDLILSNPPYIAPSDPHLAALGAEPRLALVAAEGGLACLRRLIVEAPRWLRPGGVLLLEHGWDQGEAARRLLRERGYEAIATHQDLAGRERVSGGTWPA